MGNQEPRVTYPYQDLKKEYAKFKKDYAELEKQVECLKSWGSADLDRAVKAEKQRDELVNAIWEKYGQEAYEQIVSRIKEGE